MKRGLPVFMHREVKELRGAGVDVHLLVMRYGKGVAMPEPDWPVVRIVPLRLVLRHLKFLLTSPGRYGATLIQALRENLLIHFVQAVYFVGEVQASDFDVLYCFEGKHALWIAELMRPWVEIPVVLITHADMATMDTRVEFSARAAQGCTRIISPSEYNKDLLVSRFGVEAELVEVIRLWSPYKAEERIKILIVGEWSERKGHEVLLDAFEALDPEEYVLWVVGGGAWDGDFYDVAGEVTRRRMEDRVTLWGRVSDDVLKVLFESADIFTLPSRTTKAGVTEGIPVAIMEAMSYGLPVVSSRHTGIPELVPQVLVEENDARGLAEALKRLGEDEDLRRRLGRANVAIITNRFSPRNVAGIQQVLQDVARDNSKQ